MAASGIGLAMKYFGKRTIDGKTQTLTQFRDEWNALSEESKAQLTEGLTGSESLDY